MTLQIAWKKMNLNGMTLLLEHRAEININNIINNKNNNYNNDNDNDGNNNSNDNYHRK